MSNPTPPELAGYRPVSPAEAIKWQIDNPMKEAKYQFRTIDAGSKLRYNEGYGCFEEWNPQYQCWATCELPGDPKFTYFIPEVTE